MAKKTTSPWVYVGCGCLGAVVLGIGACIGLGVVAARFGRNLEAELKDPVRRQERAREILGAEELPAGFHAQLHVAIPMLFEMVVLSDGAPVEYQDHGNTRLEARNLGDNAFIYLAMPDVGDTREQFERLLAGTDPRDLDHVRLDLDFRSEEIVGRGELDLPPQHLRYATHRGDVRDGRERRSGLYSVLLVDCPGSSKVRAAFYWQQRPDPTPAPEAGPGTDFDGAAYEDALRAFISHFQLCGA